MNILSIDPGTTKSAWLIYDTTGKVLSHGIESNEETLQKVRFWGRRINSGDIDQPEQIVIEDIEGFGLAVGKETFRTILWSGRLIEAWQHGDSQIPFYLLTRRAVKLHLCGTNRAKDANIRQSILDKFGDKQIAIGNKANPGPLYGITSHEWSALAVGITWTDLYELNSIQPGIEELKSKVNSSSLVSSRNTSLF